MTGNAYPPDSQVLDHSQQVDEIAARLDALADLIHRIERASAHGSPAMVRDQVVTHAATTRQLMEQLGMAINAFLAAEPSPDLLAQTYALVTARVRAWSRKSPLFYHIFNTPREKLGPYEVYDLLLDERSGGADVAGQVLDYYYMNMVASIAFRLRNDLLTQKLASETRRRAALHRPVRLLNLHTGPGRELRVLVRDRSLKAAMHITCLDTDASVIRRVRRELGPQLPGRSTFQLRDPRKLVASKTWPDVPYDLIYALVLFDQLSDRRVTPLIAACYRGLRPGGKLVFGNFATSMPDGEHTLIEWVLNLNLRRRDQETLRQIFVQTPFRAEDVSFEIDRFRASWLVTAERA